MKKSTCIPCNAGAYAIAFHHPLEDAAGSSSGGGGGPKPLPLVGHLPAGESMFRIVVKANLTRRGRKIVI